MRTIIENRNSGYAYNNTVKAPDGGLMQVIDGTWNLEGLQLRGVVVKTSPSGKFQMEFHEYVNKPSSYATKKTLMAQGVITRTMSDQQAEQIRNRTAAKGAEKNVPVFRGKIVGESGDLKDKIIPIAGWVSYTKEGTRYLSFAEDSRGEDAINVNNDWPAGL